METKSIKDGRNGLPEIFVSFELVAQEIQQLRDLNWRNGRADLQAQQIVRDYLLRERIRAERRMRERKMRRDPVRDARNAGGL